MAIYFGRVPLWAAASFSFLYFSKTFFYRNIFSISQFTVLYPYRPAGGRQGLICKFKKKLFARKPLAGACRPPAGRQAPCRPAGGRQAPPHCIKASLPPLICFPRHPESGRERGGVREGVVTAKPCRILDPNRR